MASLKSLIKKGKKTAKRIAEGIVDSIKDAIYFGTIGDVKINGKKYFYSATYDGEIGKVVLYIEEAGGKEKKYVVLNQFPTRSKVEKIIKKMVEAKSRKRARSRQRKTVRKRASHRKSRRR